MDHIKAMKQKILTKLEQDYSKQERSISFLKTRRKAVMVLFVIIHIAAFFVGGEALYVAFLLFGLPLLIIYGLQGTKLFWKQRQLRDLEKTILSSKE
jgi:uncharacterized membrane protein